MKILVMQKVSRQTTQDFHSTILFLGNGKL